MQGVRSIGLLAVASPGMDFRSFQRRVGGSGSTPVLGTDPTPAGAASKGRSCAFSVGAEGRSGVTFLQRLAVTYAGPAAMLPVQLWVFDQTSEQWAISGTGTISPNALTRIDCICPVGEQEGTNSVDLYILVSDPGGLAAGTYTFLLSPDSSSALALAAGGGPAVNVAVTNFPGNQPVTLTNDVVGLKNAADVRINPATEGTLAAQAATLGTISSSVSSIDTKTPAIGQAPAGGSSPAVLPASQETSLRDMSDRSARLVGKVTVLSNGQDVGPANPIPIGGIDDSGDPHTFSVQNGGGVYARPDWRAGTNYYDVPRALTSMITGGARHSSATINPDTWSFGSPITTSLASVAYDSTNGEARLRTPGTAGQRAMLLDNKGALYVFNHDTEVRLAFRSTNPTLVGKRQEWGAYVAVGAAASTGTAVGFYLEDGVWGIFLRIAGFSSVDIPQGFWSYDNLDGNGPSKMTTTPANLVGSTDYRILFGQRAMWFVGNVLVNAIDLTNPADAIAGASVVNPFVLRAGYMISDTITTGTTSDVLTHFALVETLVGNIDDAFGVTSLVSNSTAPSIASGATKPIAAIRVAATIAGVLNSYRIVPFETSVVFSTTGRLLAYWGTSDDITLTGGAWVSPPTAPLSVAQVNLTATDVTFGATSSQIRGVALAANVPVTLSFLLDFSIFGRCLTVRGDGKLPMLVLAVTNSGAGPGTAKLEELRAREVI